MHHRMRWIRVPTTDIPTRTRMPRRPRRCLSSDGLVGLDLHHRADHRLRDVHHQLLPLASVAAWLGCLGRLGHPRLVACRDRHRDGESEILLVAPIIGLVGLGASLVRRPIEPDPRGGDLSGDDRSISVRIEGHGRVSTVAVVITAYLVFAILRVVAGTIGFIDEEGRASVPMLVAGVGAGCGMGVFLALAA